MDATGSHVLSAHNVPKPGITVIRINPDGTLGSHVPQADGLDYGIYPLAGDGKLEFARKYDVDTGADRTQYWMGIIGLD